MKLRSKLFLYFIIIAVVPIVILEVFLYRNTLGNFEREITNEQTTSVNRSAARIDAFIKNRKQLAVALTDLPPLPGLYRAKETGFDQLENSTEDQWKNRLVKIFISFLESDEAIYQIRFLSLNGQEVIKVVRDGTDIIRVPEDELQNKGNKSYFQHGIWEDKGDVHVSEIELNQEFGVIEIPYKPVVRLVSPVYIDNEIFGAIVINLDLKPIQTIIASEKDQFLIDQDGYYLFGSNQDQFFSRFLSKYNYFSESGDLVENDIRRLTRSGNFVNDVKNTHVVWERVTTEDQDKESVIVMNEININAVRAIARQSTRGTITGLAMTMIAILILVLLFARKVINPIEVLAQKMNVISKNPKQVANNADLEKLVHRRDEVSTLARSFKNMSFKLQNFYETLDNRVQDRTKELDEQKKIAEAAKAEAEKELSKSEKMNRLMVNRELKMIELKKEIQRLKELGNNGYRDEK